MRKFDLRLSILQIAAIITIIVTIIAIIRLYHHQTDDYAVPFIKYLGSIRLAIPPIILFFISYVLFFIRGVKIGDAPKLVLSYFRNNYFQSCKTMLVSISALIILSGLIMFRTEFHAPPSYTMFISTLLGGEQDRHTLINKELSSLEGKNPSLVRNYNIAIEVFRERSSRNFNHGDQNTTKPRILVRALDTNIIDDYWKNHPLRMLALAEAYSMWAQAALNSPLKTKEDSNWQKWVQSSLELNKQVIESNSPLSTKLMRYSAMNNSGNVLLYTGDFSRAREFYENLMMENMNLSSAGNLIATYILLNDLDSAITFGNEVREWGLESGKALIETSSFSSVLVNLGLANLIKSNYEMASDLFIDAFDLESDNLNALNLALSLILKGEKEKALYVLSHFKYPDLDITKQAKRVTEEYNSCYYLIHALAINQDNYSKSAAYYFTYLGKPRTKEQLGDENKKSINRLKLHVLNNLKSDRTPCKNLYMVPGLRKKLGEN